MDRGRVGAHHIRRSPLALLAALTFARIAYGVQFQSVGAVGPAMIAELDLDYASLGTLMGAYSMLGLVLSLPDGWLLARLGDRPTVLAGLGLLILGGALLDPGRGAAGGSAELRRGACRQAGLGSWGRAAAGRPPDDRRWTLLRRCALCRNGDPTCRISARHWARIRPSPSRRVLARGDGMDGGARLGGRDRSEDRAAPKSGQCRRGAA
jgi:hypothetical protein